jgi:hypothetical protein
MESAAPRYELDLHLEVSVGSATALGRSRDLSVSGIGAYIPCELAIGQFVNLFMRLPFRRVDLTCGAVVRNRSGFRYGLEFSNIRMAQQEFIAELCNTLSNLSSLKNLEFDS